MTTPNLSPAQLRVLRAAAEGKVSRGYGPQRSIVWRLRDARGSRTVNAAVRALESARLLETPRLSLYAEAVPTDAGRALLATLNATPKGH